MNAMMWIHSIKVAQLQSICISPTRRSLGNRPNRLVGNSLIVWSKHPEPTEWLNYFTSKGMSEAAVSNSHDDIWHWREARLTDECGSVIVHFCHTLGWERALLRWYFPHLLLKDFFFKQTWACTFEYLDLLLSTVSTGAGAGAAGWGSSTLRLSWWKERLMAQKLYKLTWVRSLSITEYQHFTLKGAQR